MKIGVVRCPVSGLSASASYPSGGSERTSGFPHYEEPNAARSRDAHYLLHQGAEIVEFCTGLGVSLVQLNGEIEAAELRSIKEHHPCLAIIKSLVIGLHPLEQLLKLVERTASYVDAYIRTRMIRRLALVGPREKLMTGA